MKSVAYSNYIQISGPLFENVQQSQIFSDGKTFVDAIPKVDPKVILKKYEIEKGDANFDLKTFVYRYFEIFEEETHKPPATKELKAYLIAMWDVLCKKLEDPSPHSTLISLPNPHIVPGGRFRECFYWDSYYSALGLAVEGQVSRIQAMADNFSFLIKKFGFIPNGNRVYFTTRSQPPHFSLLLKLLFDSGEKKSALSYFPELEKEYLFWTKGSETLKSKKQAYNHVVMAENDTILGRYWDSENTPRPEAFKREVELKKGANHPEFYRSLRAACASGWDFSSRWLEDKKNFHTIWILDLLPVDLNSLLYHLETTLAEFANLRGDKEKATCYQNAAEKRKKAISTLFWNEKEGFFFDYHFQKETTTEVWSLAGVAPLFLKIATKRQAKCVAKHLEDKFLCSGGFVTSLTHSSHQWDMPNGWAPLQWMAIEGLRHYGYHTLASKAAKRWVAMCQNVFNQTHKMLEKYNVVNPSKEVAYGEYALQEGFGWTNGVSFNILNRMI